MNIILRLFGHRIDVMADDKKAADKAPVAEKAKPVGLSITSMLMQTVLTFVACFAACFLTFQIVPKAINVEQIIKQVEKPDSDANLPVYSLGEFVVNLADPGGTRFLKTASTRKRKKKAADMAAQQQKVLIQKWQRWSTI
jgi:flagellar basal body-associated protein FliL